MCSQQTFRRFDRLYMLAAMTPKNIQSIPSRVPPAEKAGEKNVAITTPAKVISKLTTNFKSALCRNKRIPRINVMHGIVATKIALTEAEVILIP